eukprot:CAMPEP_0172210328 /NCGR_PEP_ID=MMETSP1050-20130122/35682_1 /TAXON_ID=233186 /ORGANISM="Cryptomonas curvata, Strain CCAP979/52" /LENGTH=300 /DNA_ID=CAMNT_0012890449 /DNA_START=294 /DNA_END=1196 /DNA_ORIENTATION=+
MDSSQREFDNFSRAKSPIVAAFLTPLTASISAVRQSVESVSSGVRRYSDVARANPLFRNSRKAESSEAEAALKTNPTQDAEHCARHVVRRRVSIHARAEDVFAVAADIEGYRNWTGKGIESIRVLSGGSGDAGDPVVAQYRAGICGIAFDFALRWDLAGPDRPIRFRKVGSSGVIRSLSGFYAVEREGRERSRLTFELTSEISERVPRVLQRVIRNFVADIATGELKRHAESPAFRARLRAEAAQRRAFAFDPAAAVEVAARLCSLPSLPPPSARPLLERSWPLFAPPLPILRVRRLSGP